MQAQAEELTASSRDLMAEGRYQSAEATLSEFISAHPDAGVALQPVLLAWFDVSLNSNDLDAANNKLTQMAELPQYLQDWCAARVFIKRGQLSQARERLQRNEPPLAEAGEYYSLLAGIQHQLGDYRAAQALYRRLVDLWPRESAYWLGLAVTLDALHNDSGALQAFRYARLHGGSKSTAGNYIDQRIAALSQ